jgi:hypothetical protein
MSRVRKSAPAACQHCQHSDECPFSTESYDWIPSFDRKLCGPLINSGSRQCVNSRCNLQKEIACSTGEVIEARVGRLVTKDELAVSLGIFYRGEIAIIPAQLN